MSLELLNTLGTLTTAAIIAATAIAALVQLRHLRAGNLITALLTIENEMDNKDFRDAESLVRDQLPGLLQQHDFCKYCFEYTRRAHVTEADDRYAKVYRAAVLIANTFENLGALVKRGIFDRNLFLDIYCDIVVGFWNDLEGFTAIRRAAAGFNVIYENFEYIAVISRRYVDAHASAYPKNMERLNVRLPDAASELASTATKR